MARAPSVYGGSVRSVDSRVFNYILHNRQAALNGELGEGENPPSPVQSERSEARFDRFNNQRENLDGRPSRLFHLTCLPFGLSSAPRSFTKLLKIVVTFFRSRGVRLIIYLDDILILNQDRNNILSDLRLVIETLQSLGFLISWKKSVTDPSQCLDYLGMVIDSLNLSFSLPSNKVDSIEALCKEALAKTSLPLRDIF